MKRVLYWFRRDLRVTDNTGLYHACADAGEVIPVYILSTWKLNHKWTGANRQAFLCGCLASLALNLEHLGGRLILRSGSPPMGLIRLAHETGAQAIYFNQSYDPYGVALEDRLQRAADGAGIRVHRFKDTILLAPDEVMNQSGQPFRVFTPYARIWHAHKKPGPVPAVRKLKIPASIQSEPLPTLDHWALRSEAKMIQAGEKAARTRLKSFLNGAIFKYAAERGRPALNSTSRLSQDLRFGTLSPREIYGACQKAALSCTATERHSINVFVNELAWREFYFQILWHFPHALEADFKPQFSVVQWDQDDSKLRRWCEGTTGFPIVDAGMRELNATGFMHNRVRMIVAMFLTKDLHVHWQEGERYFMQKLVDGDTAANNGGWQWSAGTGADAAPYFRIHNPWTQTATFDPAGDYIKRWVPELQDVDPVRLTKPPPERLARGYPLPMVVHATEREIAIQRFRRALPTY